jgi:hypothetical protein
MTSFRISLQSRLRKRSCRRMYTFGERCLEWFVGGAISSHQNRFRILFFAIGRVGDVDYEFARVVCTYFPATSCRSDAFVSFAYEESEIAKSVETDRMLANIHFSHRIITRRCCRADIVRFAADSCQCAASVTAAKHRLCHTEHYNADFCIFINHCDVAVVAIVIGRNNADVVDERARYNDGSFQLVQDNHDDNATHSHNSNHDIVHTTTSHYDGAVDVSNHNFVHDASNSNSSSSRQRRHC